MKSFIFVFFSIMMKMSLRAILRLSLNDVILITQTRDAFSVVMPVQSMIVLLKQKQLFIIYFHFAKVFI